jgi:sugar/nucleoside kinase (ribokinase family)
MGGNVACAASRLGLRTGMVSWVGDDANGRLILADLQRFGVDTRHITVQSGANTNYTTVLLDPSGEKAILIVPMSFDILALDPPLTAYLQSARLVYCAAYDPEQLRRVANIVHAASGLVSTDIEPAAGLTGEALIDLLAVVDLAFIDAKTVTPEAYEETARYWRSLGPEIIIITFGAAGSLACHAAGLTRCPAFNVPVADTTGAGDCFTAAFLTAYLRQLPVELALRYASAAAALSIQGYGARSALPTDAQVHSFLADHPRASQG